MWDKKNNIVSIKMEDLAEVLWGKRMIMLTASLVCAALVGLINIYLIPPIYTSTSSIYIMSRLDESKTTYADVQTGSQLVQDYMILATGRNVMEQVIKNLGLDMSEGELESMISIVNPDDTRILEISVTDINAAMTKKLVDEIVRVSAQLLVKAMNIEQVNVIDYGELPLEPVGKNIGRSFLSGGIAGLMVSIFIIILRYMLDENLKNPEDIERLLGITTLGFIPVNKKILKGTHKFKSRNKKVTFAE